jgi:hypothetical protein
MLTRFFDNTRPITVLVLFLLLAFISAFSVYIYFTNIAFQTKYLIDPVYQHLGNIFQSIISVGLILSLGFLVNFIVHDNSITRNNSYALLFFIVLVASDPSLVILNPVLSSVFFVVLAMKNLLSLHVHKEMTQKLFNSGLLLGIASVIYPYAILYGILIFLGIVIYGADGWRKWFIPILGILVPYYFLFSWYFWFDKLDFFRDKFFIKTFYIAESSFNESPGTLLVWGVFAVLTIFSILDYSKNMGAHKPDTRKGYAMTFLALMIGLVITLVGTINNGQELIIMFLPISIIWAKFIQHQKKELWRTIFIIVVILNSAFSFASSYMIFW